MMGPGVEAVFALLTAMRLDMGVEDRAQAQAMSAMVATWGPASVAREYRLGPGDRPDFMVAGGIVVELKGPRHRQPSVLRQLQRYAAHPEVNFVILVTARGMAMPPVLSARGRHVPCAVIHMARAWL